MLTLPAIFTALCPLPHTPLRLGRVRTALVGALAATLVLSLGSIALAQPAARDDKSISIADAVAQLPPGQRPPNRFALLVGVGDYSDACIPDLPACANDARGMAAVLTDPQAGLFPKDNVTILTDKGVTKPALIDALEQLARKAGPDDLVVVFFSGHGATDERGRSYWIMHDTAIDRLRATALPETDVTELIGEIKTTRLVTLIDACYSASTINVGQAKSLLDLTQIYPKFDGTGRVAITASKGDQLSVVISDKANPGFGYSAFAWHVIEGLRGAAADENGVVTVDSLWNFVKDRTEVTARQQGGSQQPQLKGQIGSRFLLAVNAERMRQRAIADQSRNAQTLARIAAIRTLGVEGKISIEHAREGQQLLQAPPESLDEPRKGRLTAYIALADGRLAPEFFEAALGKFPLETAEQRAALAAKQAALRDADAAMARGDAEAAGEAMIRALRADMADKEVYARAQQVGDAVYKLAVQRLLSDQGESYPRLVALAWQLGTQNDNLVLALFSDHEVTYLPEVASPSVAHWHRSLSDAGHVDAGVCYGAHLAFGSGVAKDPVEAMRLFRRGADAGSTLAMNNVGWMSQRGEGAAKDPAEAMRWYRRAADAGSTVAMLNIGGMYMDGEGAEVDIAEGARLIRRAADAGNSTAMAGYGYMHQLGVGVPQDPAEAVRWYRHGAQSGSLLGMFVLASAYRAGEGVAKDAAEAFRWVRRAAQAGSRSAMFGVGVVYLEGEGVAEDSAEAMRWFRRASEAGDTDAMNRVGSLYDNGIGVALNDAEAMRWYRRAADAGNMTAMWNIGVMYINGEGVPKDEAQAIEWFRKAARAGQTQAQDELRKRNVTW